MRVHKGKAVIVGAAALALALSRCSSGSGGGAAVAAAPVPKPRGQLIFGEGSDFPENLLPLIAAGNSTSIANLVGRVLDGAFRITPNMSFQLDPDQVTCATSTIVDGQQVVDIKINPKAVWDDGQPITADDYVFTFERQKSTDPKRAAAPRC